MTNRFGMHELEAALKPGNESFFRILKVLADKSESELRRILRPHDDAQYSEEDQEYVIRRKELDLVLDALTWLEISLELEYRFGDREIPSIPYLSSLFVLFSSDSFLNYINAYLYFGVRFLAYRLLSYHFQARDIAPHDWMWQAHEAVDPAPERVGKTNQRPFPLILPPSFARNEFTQARFEELVDLVQTPESGAALQFLDGYYTDSGEPHLYELWLRGLRPELREPGSGRFETISRGLTEWAAARCEFYLSLQDQAAEAATAATAGRTRPTGGWIVVNPVAARLALADMYWIARLLRVDVSVGATVTYARASWLNLLRFQADLRHDTAASHELRRMEEVLRSVFDFVCDLAQNAVSLSAKAQRQSLEADPAGGDRKPPTTKEWSHVADRELREIMAQRERRSFSKIEVSPIMTEPGQRGSSANTASPHHIPECRPSEFEWSERLRTGDKPQNLVGLAFSGGGIRSATFNLGVLQGLQEFDQLRYVDFLSTVSGGGYIGSWLVANVKRSEHWLTRLTCWDESIAHLRAYSNYLSPKSGVLSADSWTVLATWARNAFLIQMTAFAWLLALLTSVLVCRLGFVRAAASSGPFDEGIFLAAAAIVVTGTMLTWTLVYNFTQRVDSGLGARNTVQILRTAVLPSWIGALCVAVQLWSNATSNAFAGWHGYSAILKHAWCLWWPMLTAFLIALLVIATVGLNTYAQGKLTDDTPRRKRRLLTWRMFGRAAWISPLCLLVLYLGLCAVLKLFLILTEKPAQDGSYAFVFGPALVLTAFTLSIVFFIGLSGRNSNEAQREWWTRFGTWISTFAGLGMALSAITIFGPALLLWLVGRQWHIGWAAIGGWVGTVITGLISGQSSKTSGEGDKSPLLQILAEVGGFAFILGAVTGTATVLYLFLRNFVPDAGSDGYWNALGSIDFNPLLGTLVVLAVCAVLFSYFFEINIFSLNQFYRNRLVRCYLGATRWMFGVRKPHPFTKFDFNDDMPLSDLGDNFRGPFPVLGCSLNLAGSSDLALHTRHSASFSLTPFYCGCDRPLVGYAPTLVLPDPQAAAAAQASDSQPKKAGHDVQPAQQAEPAPGFADGVTLGQAVSISGAAASPNMGYNTSPLVAFLLTMFNVRLAWWFPNPGQSKWSEPGMGFGLYYLVRELLGIADEKRHYLNVSDGGHFENLAIYELVRRRCKVIIASDAECDQQLQFGGLGNVIRLCKTDFDAEIDIDVKAIREQKAGASVNHCSVGRIKYANGSIGYLVYIKASLTGDEDVSIAQYKATHPSFPHETTADQFFTEDQFESYRRLGQHIVRHAFRTSEPGDHPVSVAESLSDILAPVGCDAEAFFKHSRALDAIWERFRQSSGLHPFLEELMGAAPPDPSAQPTPEEFSVVLELLQLMESVYLDLRMDDFWDHPDNRGWAMLFMGWARSPRFREVYAQTHRTFGIRFEYFCDARLGLTRDNPIVRV